MPKDSKTGDSAEEARRLVVRFEGRVQGVGFRYTTVHVASSFAVTGFVRNEPDGSVMVVAEGGEAELIRFLNAVRASALGRFISGDKMTWEPATGEFTGFVVAHSRYWS